MVRRFEGRLLESCELAFNFRAKIMFRVISPTFSKGARAITALRKGKPRSSMLLPVSC